MTINYYIKKGTIMYELLEGFPPFFNEDLAQMYKDIQSGKLKFSKKFSPEAKSLLEVFHIYKK